MKKFLAVIVALGAIFGFDYFVDLPEFLQMPEMFECVSPAEIATGIEERGFEFCSP